jgi:hypothetical protein
MNWQLHPTSQFQLILFTEGPNNTHNQSPGETTSELPFERQYQYWTPKELLGNFYQKTELVVVPEHGVSIFFSFSFLFLYYYLHHYNSVIPILTLFTLPPPVL